MAQQAAKSSIGFTGLLGLLFIGLKLAGFIAWPWYMVLAPLWFPLASILCIAALFLLIALVVHALPSLRSLLFKPSSSPPPPPPQCGQASPRSS